MGDTGYSSSRRRRRILVCLLIIVLVFLLIVAVAAVVILVTLKPKDPTFELLSANVTGFAPRVTLPNMTIQLNVTLLLAVRVGNPNPVAFDNGVGTTVLVYRGVQVGSAEVPPGTIPAKGSTTLKFDLTVEADRLVANPTELLGDVLAGEIEFTTNTTIPGEVKILGSIKLHAQAQSTCHVTIGITDFKVRRQDCDYKTKL